MQYRVIVCGVIGSEESDKAALGAALLARSHQASLIYVYAVDVGFLKGMTVEVRAEFAEQSLEHLGGHILERAAEIAREQGVSCRKVIKKGPVLEVLKQVLTDEKADLLVLGREKRTFFEKVLIKGQVEDYIDELKKQTGVEVTVIK